MCTKRLKFFNQKQIYFLPCFQKKKKKKHNCLFFPSLPYFSPHRLAAGKEGKILRDATRAEIDMTIFRTDAHSKPMINAFARYVYTRKRSYFTSRRKWVRLHRGTCIELRDEWMLWKERERKRRKEGIAEKEQKRAHWNSILFQATWTQLTRRIFTTLFENSPN